MNAAPSSHPHPPAQGALNGPARELRLDDLTAWLAGSRPGRVLVLGEGAARVALSLRTLGIEACWQADAANFTQPYAQAGRLAQTWQQVDTLLAVEPLPPGWLDELREAVQASTAACPTLLLWQAGSAVDPQQVRGLAATGYTRLPAARPANISVYRARRDPLDVLQDYEDTLWEVQQAAERQTALLGDYHQELLDELEGIQRGQVESDEAISWQEQARYWQHRWQALEASRTWRVLSGFQKVRQFLIPRGGRLENLIKAALAGLRRAGHALRQGLKPGGLKLLLQPPRKPVKVTWQASPLPRRAPALGHQASVDVIVCVHNALEDVRACLASLVEWTSEPYRILLVDDGSGPETAGLLRQFAAEHPGCLLLRSEEGTGYTYAANRGLRASNADFVVLLNSDTIVTPHWLDGMIACAGSSEKIGVVGPLSNTASWQSIPDILIGEDWATNPLPDHISVADYGRMVTERSQRIYPRMPFLNGFCLMIRRAVIDQIGYLDEENFGAGYGEEDDYNLRARKAGWELAIADDVYIYHAQSKSYSSERRKQLSARAGGILIQKHGQQMVHEGVSYCRNERVLQGIRAYARHLVEMMDTLKRGRQRFEGKRVLFILPVTLPGGGANVIFSEARAMQQMGVQVEFFNLRQFKPFFEQAYPNLPFACRYGQVEDLPGLAGGYDAVLATVNHTVGWLKAVQGVQRGYYIQGFEPLIFTPGSPEYQVALDSYTLIPGMIKFCKTEWTRRQVQQHCGCDVSVIGISLETNLFRPRPRQLPPGPVRIAAMVRPETPYREPEKTMQLLQRAKQEFGAGVEVLIFGAAGDDPNFLKLPHRFDFHLAGILRPEEVYQLLNEADIFVDYSSHQAMGLTALEAMSCGCAVILPTNGGAVEFASPDNSLPVDMSAFENVWAALQTLLNDPARREAIGQRALQDVSQYTPEKAAYHILERLFGDEPTAEGG